MTDFKTELTDNILNFWINRMQDTTNGGFYACIKNDNSLDPYKPKGAVLNARILWTFSAAYRLLKQPIYLEMAQRAFNYICNHFIDPINGGLYWELDYLGKPLNTKKQIYAQGFALYGLSEFYRASQNTKALDLAKELFFLIEQHKDVQHGGYFEAFTADWQPIADMRLSNKDANEKKSQNTHLHILEPYTNLCRIWKNDQLITAQEELIEIFLHKILNPDTHHLHLFMDENWHVKSSAISFGHDIEASWLLVEAAEVLGNKDLIERVKSISLKIADAAAQGLAPDGSMFYEKDFNHIDEDRHWWVQAEAVVGYMYAYRNSGDLRYKNYAEHLWSYIQNQIIDPINGEWYWSRLADGSINQQEDKAGFWKCPYHNGRMCMEMMEMNLPSE